jgi:tetratricopeptide (TPR) repeat protein
MRRRVAQALLFVAATWGGVRALAVAPQAACGDGDRALAASDWSAAEAAYEVCVQLNPSFAVFSNMGVALAHMGRMPEAITSYTKALALDPSNTHVEFNLSVALVEAGNYTQAAEHLKHLTRAGGDLRYNELLAFSYYHLDSYALAAREAERVYAEHPQDAANALILGSAYTRLHQYDRALPLITQALQAAGSAEGHLILAQTLIGLHQYTAAGDELKQIATSEPDYPGLHEALGEVDVGTERTQAAEAEFMLAARQNTGDFEANYFLARLKRFDGDLAAAKHYLAVAEQLRPGAPDVAYERAEIAMKERRFADAVPLLEFAIHGEPDEPQAYLLLAQAYQRTGRHADAQREGELYGTKLREARKLQEARDQALAQKTR